MTLKGFKYYLGNPKHFYGYLSSRGLLDWIPDGVYLKFAYKVKTKNRLNLKTPRTFNEKLQWLKINNRKDLYTILVDKYAVREFIKETIGEEYLIPLVGGPWNSPDEIDFDALPDQFVLKCNHDSGGLSICRDKSKFDFESAKKKLARSLKRNYYRNGREWPYKNVKPCIIAEAYMDDFNPDEEGYGGGLTDYKFFTFNGVTKMLYISRGLEDHSTARISFYDLEGEQMPFKRSDYKGFEDDVKMPGNMTKMVELSDMLSKKIDSPFLRVDFYEINGKVYFSEFTFYPCSGMMPIEPKEWDETIGSWIEL